MCMVTSELPVAGFQLKSNEGAFKLRLLRGFCLIGS